MYDPLNVDPTEADIMVKPFTLEELKVDMMMISQYSRFFNKTITVDHMETSSEKELLEDLLE